MGTFGCQPCFFCSRPGQALESGDIRRGKGYQIRERRADHSRWAYEEVGESPKTGKSRINNSESLVGIGETLSVSVGGKADKMYIAPTRPRYGRIWPE